MSRVRILNLPKESTEASVRAHFTTGLPPSAPSVQITDCYLKRSPDGLSIRMGFLGFRTSAAGQFVIRHFDGTYFKNCKLRLEPATGLNESTVTTNLKKRVALSGGERSMPSYIKQPSEPTHVATAPTNANGKRGRVDVSGGAEEAKEGDPLSLKVKDRKREFVDERLKSANAPSWSGEVLLPVGASTSAEGGGAAEHHNAGGSTVVDEGVVEAQALHKQQELGAVGDMDFLASLTTGGGGASIGPSDDIQVDDNEEPRAAHNATTRHDKSAGNATPQPEAAAEAEDPLELARSSRRVLVRGIPFSATEDDVKNYFSSKVGPIETVHIPITRDTKQSKGSAFVRFQVPEHAASCVSDLQGAVFMGRLVHVSAVDEDPYAKKAEATAARLASMAGASGTAPGGLPSEYKTKKGDERKRTDATGASWNATYMNTHTAVENVAKRMGVTSTDIVSVEHKGAAVRAAIAEAFLTSEVKTVLGDEGIDLDVLHAGSQAVLKARSNVTILVKNLTTKADLGQLSKMFLKFGTIDATAIPTSGAFAVFRFLHAQDARVAFQRLAYKPFCGQPLFLEWAPIGTLKDSDDVAASEEVAEDGDGAAAAAQAPTDAVSSKTQQLTLFVTNLPFRVAEEKWVTFLQDACPRLSVNFNKIVTRLNLQSEKGRCFLTCADPSSFTYLMAKLNGKSYEGRTLSCVASKSAARTADNDDNADAGNDKTSVAQRGATIHASSTVPAGCDPLKVIIKNLPFEATEKDLRELFAAFTEIKAVRVPKKVNQFGAHRDNNHRGFGFVEFLTEQEAASALKALSSTHLYGRHLVLQYAKMGADN